MTRARAVMGRRGIRFIRTSASGRSRKREGDSEWIRRELRGASGVLRQQQSGIAFTAKVRLIFKGSFLPDLVPNA